jgi:hypothetical protein
MCDTSMMPLRVAIPNTVMNPINDATDSMPPEMNTPAMPPISAHGGDGHGHGQGGEQRDHIGGAERPEEPPLDPRQEKQGEKYEDDNERREDDRRPDLDTRLVDHLQHRSALVVGEPRILPQSSKDVLHVDHSIVDQRPDRNGHPAQSHRVDRRTEFLQGERRRQQ